MNSNNFKGRTREFVCLTYSYNRGIMLLVKLGEDYYDKYIADLNMKEIDRYTVCLSGPLTTLLVVAAQIHMQFLSKGLGYDEMKLSSGKPFSTLTVRVRENDENKLKLTITEEKC